jgi:hypothetical protein
MATVAGLAPLHAGASVGTGVGANPITLADPAQPGHSYALPRLYVVNTGTETSRYSVRVVRIEQGRQHAVPSSWVAVPGDALVLDPKAAVFVPLTLNVPAGAAGGDYMSDLVAGTVAPGATSGASLGAQAATRLLFTVGPAEGGPLWPPPLWVELVAGLAVLGALGLAVRRSGLRFHVERRH